MKERRLTIGIVFLAVVSFGWLILRTGRKPSRIVYPCQRAAMTNVQSFLLVFAPTIDFRQLSMRALRSFPSFASSPSVKICFLIGIILLTWVSPLGSTVFTTTSSMNILPVQLDLKSQTMPLASSNLFFVQNASGVDGNMDEAISTLMSLMQNHSVYFFKTSSQPNGLVAKDDVVLIKVNAVGPERAGTNTDLIKSLIKKILGHPEGFNGEIVVADNGQYEGCMDPSESNAYDHSQSFSEIANMFPSYKVSIWSWYDLRVNIVNEYSYGDYSDGYVVNPTQDPTTGIQVSYPKFKTKYGTYISFKDGIWSTETQSFDSEKLKVINCPVLKSHYFFGVTGCVKMYQGVRYISSQQVAHDQLKLGALGTEMAETRFPTLNLLDAIWVNANPIEYGDPITGDGNCGPPTPYDTASYTNVIGASQDPVAMDYWASKNILIPAAEAKGYTSISSLDPDYASLASQRLIESFHNYLSRSMDELMKAGYQVTMNGSQMNVYVAIPASSTNLAVTNYSIQTNGSMFLCTVQSNSLVSSYIFDQPSKEIKFSVTGDSGTVGVCNVTFPTQLLGGSLTVLIDGSPRPATITYNATHTSIYFTYSHSTHQVEIIGTLVVPEFPSMVANITVLAVLTLMLILKKRSLGARCFFGEN